MRGHGAHFYEFAPGLQTIPSILCARPIQAVKYCGMDYECWPLGDRGLLLRFGAEQNVATNLRVHQAASRLRAARLPGVAGVSVGYVGLVLEIDLWTCRASGGLAVLRARVDEVLSADLPNSLAEAANLVTIDVHYGGEAGPDLEAVSRAVEMAPESIVALHSGAQYQVAMLGFLPGFAYLLGLPESLRLPRRSQVRARVPAGSVAIAGAQTGIYPQESPGGWHIIGRTQCQMFDPGRAIPALLGPGDRVRFARIA